MKKKRSLFLIAICILGLSSVQGQLQLFEMGNNGVVPFLGFRFNPDIQEWMIGAEYTVESKFSIGGLYSKPLTDTLFESHTDISSHTINPYLSLELIEPDKQFPLSFALNAGYAFHNGSRTQPVIYIDDQGNDATHETTWEQQTAHIINGGPVVGMRFFVGGTGIVVPSVGYTFSYVFNERLYHKEDTTAIFDFIKTLDKEKLRWHDIYVDVPYSHMFNDVFGVTARPKVGIRLDDKTKINFSMTLNAGIVIQIY